MQLLNKLGNVAVALFLQTILEKVMLVFGTEDKFITEETREKLISEFPSAKSVVIPETGHNSFIEAPEKVSEALDEFIGK